MDSTSALILSVTIFFSPLAGLVAYIVTFDEYERHLGKKAAKKQSLQAAIFTFIIFIFVGLISGYVFNTYINH